MTSRSKSAGLFVVIAAVVLFVAMAGFVLIGGGWLGGIHPPASRLAFTVSGQGDLERSAEFTITPGWELRWEHSGELQEICWTDAAGKVECFSAMHRKPIRPNGSVNVRHGGRFTLNVKGQGTWRLDVYQLGN